MEQISIVRRTNNLKSGTKTWIFILIILIITGCKSLDHETPQSAIEDSLKTAPRISNTNTVVGEKNIVMPDTLVTALIYPKKPTVDSITKFATTLIGTPYKYGSTNPAAGFDCSGFITYVYNHFRIKVPRSSIDFTNVGTEIPVTLAKKGDLILFTGTDSSKKFVGHMGIILSNKKGEIEFIHSSSGKADGVVITPLNDYYKGRFVKVIRIPLTGI